MKNLYVISVRQWGTAWVVTSYLYLTRVASKMLGLSRYYRVAATSEFLSDQEARSLRAHPMIPAATSQLETPFKAGRTLSSSALN